MDVFGQRPLTGNPLAVVIDSDGLSEGEMLEITQWLAFSETTFLCPPEDAAADYRVRIFSLAGELPFAGHPTLGTCHVWQTLAGESKDEIVQQCGAGLVRLRRLGDSLEFAAPPLARSGPVDEDLVTGLAEVLRIERSTIVDTAWVDNGPGWVGVLLGGVDDVLGLHPDFSRYEGDEPLNIGVVGFGHPGSETLYEVRAFFADQRGNAVEDPVTGSLNASLAQWFYGSGLVEGPYVASQGTALARSGRIHISRDDSGVWVGGSVFDIVHGHLGELIGGRG